MPGTLVTDAIAVDIFAGVTLNAAGTTSGTVQQLDKPGQVQVEMITGTVTGTSPTLDVEVKGADDSAFTTNVVSFGRFSQLSGTGSAQTGLTRRLFARVDKKYVRATVIVGGTTPVYTGTTCKLVPPNKKRNAKDTTA